MTPDDKLRALYSYMTEKATREQYRIKAFKKKYNFVPDKGDPTQGTITVDGKTYRVDMDVTNPWMHVKDHNGNIVMLDRMMSAEIDSEDKMIHLNRAMFKTRKAKRGRALLQHEIGHINLHNTNSKVDNDITRSIIEDIAETFARQATTTGDNITELKNAILSDPKLIEKLKQCDSKSEYEKVIRDAGYRIAKKYEGRSSSSHANALEFEADRYAANREGSSALKRGLNDIYKSDAKQTKKRMESDISSIKERYHKAMRKCADDFASKKITKSKYEQIVAVLKNKMSNEIDETQKAYRKLKTDAHSDQQIRSKALKDKELATQAAYKK